MSTTLDLDGETLTLPTANDTSWDVNLNNTIASIVTKANATETRLDATDTSGVTLTGVQTLTNKTLTAPTINAATLTGTISGGTFASSTLTAPTINAATLTGTISGGTFTSSTLTSPAVNTPTVSFASGGSVTLPAWTNLVYSNSWVTFSATPTAGWRKLADGNIQLRGAIKSGTTTDATTMFTLPAGARPQSGHKHLFRPGGSATSGICEISDTGAVKIYALGGTNTELNIDGVIFPTT